MPSNKKRGNSNNNSNNNNNNKNNNDDDDLKQEGNVKLQAVLLADSVFGSKTTKNQDYQSFGLRPWSAEASTSVQILCTINNVPLVDYVLDFLTSNGVEQVIVVTGSESSALEDYIVATTNNNNSNNSNNNNSNNNTNSSSSSNNNKRNLEILFLRDTSLTNAGDALRELYKRNWIRASKQALPFLLVSGDVVADLDLKEAMRAHKDRHSHDSAAVMTVVLKPVKQSRSSSSSTNSTSSTNTSSSSSSIVPRASELVVGLVGAFDKTIATADAQGSEKDPSIDDSKDYRIMYYENGSRTSSYMLPCSFLTQCQTQCQTQSGTNNSSSSSTAMGGLVVRHDLMDTGIAICSPDVLGRLEDEFDYLDLAHDFVTNSVAEEEDGLQTRIYAHVLEDATSSSRFIANNNGASSTRNYAARVVDFQTFHAVSRDLLRRWAYPTVADRTILSNNNNSSSSNSSIGTKETNKRYKLVEVADHNHHRRSGYNNTNRPLVSLENNNNNKNKNSTNSKNKSYDPFSKISSSHNNNQYQYKEVLNPTKVSRTSVVVGPGMMGSYGTVGEDCLVARCVLGDSVTIGDGSRLVDCHLMDNVVIESGATLDSCVLASKAMVREGAVLGTGCYIGEGCIVGAGITLKPFTRVTLAKDDEDDDWGDSDGGYSDTDDDDGDIDIDNDDGVDAQNVNTGDCDQNLVGADGRGKLWKPVLDDLSSDDEDSDSGGDPLEELLQLQSIGGDPTSYYRREERRLAAREARDLEDDGFSDRDENEMDEMVDETRAFSEFTGGTVTFGNDDDDLNYTGAAATAEATVIGRQKGIDVVREMTEICMEFDDECHPIENLAIELNSFKFSQNATYGDCAQACLLSLLRKMEVSPSMSDGRMVSLLKAKLDKFWTGMLQKLCRGTEEEVSILEALEHAATIDQQQLSQSQTPTPTDPESVDALQKSTEIAQKLRSGMAFRFFLQTLHDREVLSEEAFLQWAGDRRKAEAEASNDPKQSLFQMQSVQDFLEWLEDEDSDDDDDESDDDDSDSD